MIPSKIKQYVLILCLLGLSAFRSYAQEYQYHKVYIYNFTKYIQWPSQLQSGDFVIGIYGKSQMLNELKSMAANRTVGAQKIIIKEVSSFEEAVSCHVLFVPSNKSHFYTDLKSRLDNKPILIITEKDGLAKLGSSINFVLVDGKLKYELNKTSLDKSGLKVMPDLLKLAILVNS